jgi:hypothetical protein
MREAQRIISAFLQLAYGNFSPNSERLSFACQTKPVNEEIKQK